MHEAGFSPQFIRGDDNTLLQWLHYHQKEDTYLACIGDWYFIIKAADHKIEQIIPALKVQISCKSADIIKKGFSSRQFLTKHLIIIIHDPKQGMKEEGEDVERN